MVHHDACPLCNSEKIYLHLQCRDHFLTNELFSIFKCTDCSFEFTQDHPEASDTGRYYNSDEYLSHTDISGGMSGKMYRFVRNIMLNRKKVLIENISGRKKGTILDIGSGSGYFASTMMNAGWKTTGIEINEKVREYSVSKFGIEVIDPVYITALETGSFDCITLWHVLEHFNDPFNFASEIIRLLKPRGICLVALPNCSSFDACYYREYWAAYDVPRHLWHFSPGTFRIFFEKTGFSIEKIMNLPADVFYISWLSEKYKGSFLSFFKGIIMGEIFAVRAFFYKERGSSLIYILRKPVKVP